MTTDIWTNPSALWNTWTDLSRNGDTITQGFYYGVNSLAYDSSNNVMVSGGVYYSNNKEFLEPFISYKSNTDTIWSDPSAIQFNPNWTDLFNGPLPQFPIFFLIKYGVNALAYDSSNQVMYAGGSYVSQNFQSLATPFIVSNSNPLDSNGWSDPSAIQFNPNWTDLSNIIFESEDENSIPLSGSVKCLAYDSSNNTMYAGGTYFSNSRGSFVPFIVYNSTPLDPTGWSDPSAIWNNPNWTDLSNSDFFNLVTTSQEINISGFVNSLAYDSLHNTMCAGGSYFSNSRGTFVPFIVYNSTPLDPNGWSDPSAIQFNPNWTDLSGRTGEEESFLFFPIYGINSLKYDSSTNIMYAGGSYYSNSIDLGIVPFIVSNNNSSNPNGWTNPSSLSSNLNWTTTNSFGGIINSLEFDSLNNVMYASGMYGYGSDLFPFIVSNTTPLDPNVWTNPSGLRLSPNWTDLSVNTVFSINGIVNVLANDSSSNVTFAGGNYFSNGTGSKEPFIVSNDYIGPGPGPGGPVATGLTPVGLSISDGYIYVSNNGDNTIGKINLSNDNDTSQNWATTGLNPSGLSISDGYIYLANTGDNTIGKISLTNPVTDNSQNWATTGLNPNGLSISDGYIYVSNSGDNTIGKISLTNPVIDNSQNWATTGLNPNGLSFSDGYIYVSNSGDNTIGKISLTNPVIDNSSNWATTGLNPSGLSIFNRYIYLANSGDNTIGKISLTNPSTDNSNNWGTTFGLLKTIGGGFYIINNNSLISKFNELTTINGDLYIYNSFNDNNDNSLNSFTSLETIGGFFDINTNANLKSITGFTSLTTIGGYFYIYENPSLETIDGFTSLTTISGEFYIGDDNSLNLISSFTALETISGDFSIIQNPSLETISGFTALTPISGIRGTATVIGSTDVSTNIYFSTQNAIANATDPSTNTPFPNTSVLVYLQDIANLNISDNKYYLYSNISILSHETLLIENNSLVIETYTLENRGTIDNTSGGTIYNNNSSGIIDNQNGGNIYNTGGTINNTNFGNINGTGGTINNQNGGNIYNTGGTIRNENTGGNPGSGGGTINNQNGGNINNVSGMINNFNNGAGISIGGTINNQGGTINNNTGNINSINLGSIINNQTGTITNVSGIIYIDGATINNSNAGAINNGTISGTLINVGTIYLGDGINCGPVGTLIGVNTDNVTISNTCFP